MSLDDIDTRIITALIRDARASYAVIGSEVGLSVPAVYRDWSNEPTRSPCLSARNAVRSQPCPKLTMT